MAAKVECLKKEKVFNHVSFNCVLLRHHERYELSIFGFSNKKVTGDLSESSGFVGGMDRLWKSTVNGHK